jgi:ABC-type multidrug transport system ATPase subunit
LDEPFTGLTQEQTLKLVKIIRQKNDCTLIVTAKSKASIEMLQPHQVLTIQSKQSQYQGVNNVGHLISLRLKPYPIASDQEVENMEEDELGSFIERNFGIFERLRGKKRTLINSAI